MRFWRFKRGSDPPGSRFDLGTDLRREIKGGAQTTDDQPRHLPHRHHGQYTRASASCRRAKVRRGYGPWHAAQHLVQGHRQPVRRIPLGVSTIDAVRGEQGDEQGERRDEAAGNVINACLIRVLEAYRIVEHVLELPAQRGKHPRDPHVGAAPHYLRDRRAFYRARHAPEVGREVCDRHAGLRAVLLYPAELATKDATCSSFIQTDTEGETRGLSANRFASGRRAKRDRT